MEAMFAQLEGYIVGTVCAVILCVLLYLAVIKNRM